METLIIIGFFTVSIFLYNLVRKSISARMNMFIDEHNWSNTKLDCTNLLQNV